MTWADYHPIPGVNWADPALVPIEKAIQRRADRGRFSRSAFRHHAAQEESDLFGNPQIDPIAREQVPQFYADFYNTPGAS